MYVIKNNQRLCGQTCKRPEYFLLLSYLARTSLSTCLDLGARYFAANDLSYDIRTMLPIIITEFASSIPTDGTYVLYVRRFR